MSRDLPGSGRSVRRNPCLPCVLAGNPSHLEDLSNEEVTWIAKLLELRHPLPSKKHRTQDFGVREAPDVFWSEHRRTLYAFPGLDLSLGVCRTPVGREVYQRWTGGKEPSWCGVLSNVPRIALRMVGRTTARDFILYLSNKWDPYWVRYNHMFDPGNRVLLGPGNPPAAIVVRGPPLRLTEHGLEG